MLRARRRVAPRDAAARPLRRVAFAGRRRRPGYLNLHGRIDVGLDTFPYNGHTTTADALWMGVPVVTLVGATDVARGGLSLLTTVGLPELATSDADAYVRIAAALAADLPRLATLRATLRDRVRASPLGDGPAFARDVEAAYLSMLRARAARPPLEPDHAAPPCAHRAGNTCTWLPRACAEAHRCGARAL